MTSRPIARRAVIGDEDEIVRLRDLMRAALVGAEADSDEVRGAAVEKMREWLKDEAGRGAVAFVIDAPDGNGLAASVIGAVDERLPTAVNPLGRAGYVYG